MATYTTEQLLTSILSTEFYSAETIDDAISALSGEIGDIVDAISADINPRLRSIADAVSAHVDEMRAISAISEDITDNISDLSGDVDDLNAINTQLAAISAIPTDGSASTLDVINKVSTPPPVAPWLNIPVLIIIIILFVVKMHIFNLPNEVSFKSKKRR